MKRFLLLLLIASGIYLIGCSPRAKTKFNQALADELKKMVVTDQIVVTLPQGE